MNQQPAGSQPQDRDPSLTNDYILFDANWHGDWDNSIGYQGTELDAFAGVATTSALNRVPFSRQPR